ncbi:MAG TPA: hypothetical protein VFZ14_15455 [Burkholderiales bacterium]|nr:hypothetical protein [Burkholderiales bacterium]
MNGTASGSSESGSVGASSSLTTLPKGQQDRAVTLANRELAAAGISNPTAAQTQTALTGGTVTNAQGESTELPGVLQLRSEGMGWGQVAHAIGVHPAQSERGASRSARAFEGGERVASISASGSNTVSRDATPSLGTVAISGANSPAGAHDRAASGLTSRPGHRDHGPGIASSAASGSRFGNSHNTASAVSGAGSQASLPGSKSGSGAGIRGPSAGREAVAASTAVSGAHISGVPGHANAGSNRGSIGGDDSARSDHARNSGKAGKH